MKLVNRRRASRRPSTPFLAYMSQGKPKDTALPKRRRSKIPNKSTWAKGNHKTSWQTKVERRDADIKSIFRVNKPRKPTIHNTGKQTPGAVAPVVASTMPGAIWHRIVDECDAILKNDAERRDTYWSDANSEFQITQREATVSHKKRFWIIDAERRDDSSIRRLKITNQANRSHRIRH
jgi:hypothetical protein